MRAYSEGLVLAVVALVGLWGAWQVPAASTGDTWAGIVPFSASLALLGLASFMLGSTAFAGAPKPGEDEKQPFPGNVIGLFVIALLYQQSIRWFGYVLPTALAAPVVLFLFGIRSRVGLAVSVILCPLIFHILFFELLGVFPPYGEVFDLLDWIKG